MRWRTLKKTKQSFPNKSSSVDYAPFASRALAFLTDIFMLGLPISLILMTIFGYDQMHTAGAVDVITNNQEALKNSPNPLSSILQIILFMAITVELWHRYTQTPGKKLAHICVVDATTLKSAPYWKLFLRFIGYFLSFISIVGFFIGFFRKDKRCLHDLLSGTAVIREV
ncbi:MAG: RDD family protein [Sulfuricurvum sp.]|nr:RDD family protein [Sulfuricurvum sp.]